MEGTTTSMMEEDGGSGSTSSVAATAPSDAVPVLPAAPVFPLSSRSLLCVEHPAHVRDVQRALVTLGGLPAISKEKAKFMELRFRPEDPYSHPIFGDHTLGSSLLLKVTRRRKKTPQPSSSSSSSSTSSVTATTATGSSSSSSSSPGGADIKAEVMGVVTAVYQFRGMADFQYIPPAEVVIKEQRGAFQLMSEEWGEEDEPMHLPPPMFSKIDMPQNYRFQPNALYRVVEDKGPNGEVTKKFERALKRQPVTFTRLPAVAIDEEGVPQAPPPDEQKKSQDLQRLEALLRTLFEQRPIWSFAALKANTPPELHSKLKRAIASVAYNFKSGPWRKLWVRYAHDPRQHPESRIYQVIDFRVTPEQTRQKPLNLDTPAPRRRKRRVQIDVSSLLHQPSAAPHNEQKEVRDLEYRFMVLPSHQQTLYQLCDIEEPRIQRLVHSPDSYTPTFSKTNGFYTVRTLDAIRRLMNERLTTLLADAAKQKTDEEEEHEEEELPTTNTPMTDASGPASTTTGSSSSSSSSHVPTPPAPLAAHLEKISSSVSMLERMLRSGVGRGEGDDDVEPFGLLDEDSIMAASDRPGFFSRLLQNEEPIDYIDEEEEDEEEEEEEDEEDDMVEEESD